MDIAISVDLWYVCWRRELIYIKKQIIVGVGVIACVALHVAVWPWSTEVGVLPSEPAKAAVVSEIEAQSEKRSHIFVSADALAPETEAVSEGKLEVTTITAEKETETMRPAEPTSRAVSKSAPAFTEPKSGDRTVIDSKPYIWIPGFGRINLFGVYHQPSVHYAALQKQEAN